MQLSLNSLDYLSPLSIPQAFIFPTLYLAFCTGCFGCFLSLSFMYDSGWPIILASWEALQACLPHFFTGFLVIYSPPQIFVDENICQFCEHLNVILKSHLATTGIYLELILDLEVMFSEPPS